MTHSPEEVKRIVRRFTHALGSNIGPDHDIPAPDVGTTQPDDGLGDGHLRQHSAPRAAVTASRAS